MSLSKNEYGNLARKYSPPSPVAKDCLFAFLTGGSICTFAEILNLWFSSYMTGEESRMLAMITVIAVTAVLT
ncbi:MAG: SpoVA/SpoVAEb family sporulation membrane protein, partial [Clostridia bacterium]|nr:SpoVA/SpoVAEb family sporulation membrane protein [Clostridia bacterium]